LRSYEDAIKLQNNLDGMMRGQSGIGNPWILTAHLPSNREIYETMIRHLDYMMLCEYFFEKQKSLWS
jgi:tRNA-dihydrouridine synthase